MRQGQQILYTGLAEWWPLLSAPGDYAEEAVFYGGILKETAQGPVKEVLELGCGGGNNASHLKAHFRMTLTDRSPGMLAVSRRLNPECEHAEGDMRTLRLGREFDAVFVHDAVCYITSLRDLDKTLETVFIHCRPGGSALVVPDHVKETFRDSTSHGGHDDGVRGIRYLSWTWDPDPDDQTCLTDFAYLLREEDGRVRCVRDRHHFGLFPEGEWLRLLEKVGFRARVLDSPFGEDGRPHRVFAGVRPAVGQ